MTFDLKNRIIRAKIQIQKRNSFWAYLSLYLKFKEIEKGKMMCDTMGVNCETGEVSYVKEFVEKLSDDELMGVIVHELNHIAFLTELRRGNRDRSGWGCATDLAINTLLKNNNFTLPTPNICADYNDEFNMGTKKIKDVSKLTAEEIYDKLPKIKMKGMVYVVGDGKGKGKELGKAFDKHFKSKGKDGKGLTPKEQKALKKKWMDKVQEAITISKMKGDIPVGMERLIGKLHEEKINWKALLQRFIVNQIPYNHTWCVDKNTLIETPKGKIKIKDLEENQKIYGVKDGKMVSNKIKEKFESNIRKKFVIYTKSGKRLICSGKHKILTPNGYKKAKDLNIGELCITI